MNGRAPTILTAVVLGLSLALAQSAHAGGGGGHGKKSAEGGEKAPKAAPSVSMPMLVAPMNVDGKMQRYIFLAVELVLTDAAHKSMMLEKIPYLQDAFLRNVHALPVGLSTDPKTFDNDGLAARLMADCLRVVWPDIVKNVNLRDTGADYQ